MTSSHSSTEHRHGPGADVPDLGRLVTGVIVVGDRRGRLLGFPTANIVLTAGDDVADGVYAGWYRRPGGEILPAAVSVGRRATFYAEGSRLLEAHLLDFAGDLYGEVATVELVGFIRRQRRFDSPEALRDQLARDVAGTRERLLDPPAGPRRGGS